MEAQKCLFEHINKMYPNIILKDVIAEILGTKKDATYDRIKGKKELSFSELQKICDHFNLSMDEFLNRNMKQNILFQFHPVSDENSYADHMSQLSSIFHKTSLATEKELLIMAQDIPFYYFMKYPELAIFKIYAWYCTQNRSAESFSEFSKSSKNKNILSTYEKIYHHYRQIPSKEVWTPQTIDTTLRMLEFYNSIEAFSDSKDMPVLIAGQLMDLLNTVKKYATDGYKSDSKTPFALYVCPVDVENNIIMLRKNSKWSCIIQLYAINRIITGNIFKCDETLQWLESLILKSMLISGTANKERLQFFKILNEKVQNCIANLNS